MATEALQEIFRRHDIEQTDSLDKQEWIELCAQDGINLSPDMAGALFDGLDADSDGQVKISDIMKELLVYEATAERPVTPQSRRSSSLGRVTYVQPASFDPRTPEVKEHRRRPMGQANRLHRNQLQSHVMNPNMDGFNDSCMTQKETTADGTEVFSVNPTEISPRRKQLMELETEISRSVPELLPIFTNVVDDFRSEIQISKKEKSNLEENYFKEKEARRRDMTRLENELELQIQRIEEKTRSEVQDLIREEYDSKIMNKEEEIAEIREQVRRLKRRIHERESIDGTAPDSTTNGWWSTDSSLRRRSSRRTSELDPDRNRLTEIVGKLQKREAELSSLKEQLELQEKQIMLDKRELLNREEEKLQLYSQLQNLRFALAQQEDDKWTLHMTGTHSTSANSASGSTQSADENMSRVMEPPKTPKAPERIYKVILVGDTGVGKSSFMHQFCDGVFYPRLRATVGVDFRTRNLRVDKTVYSIQLWDTAGQEKYRSIVKTYFRKVDGVIIMYDVTAPDTFRNVRSWMEQIVEHENESKVPVVIVGNKTDLRNEHSNAVITTEMGLKFAESHSVLFVETSIPSAENVDEAVQLLACQMKLTEDARLATVQLTVKPQNPTLACCK